MARSLRDIRQKIKGVTATRQVTKAMELVSASKMRKAIEAVMRLRRYSFATRDVLTRIARLDSVSHPALAPRPVKNVLAIVFTSDRGLTGNLNAQMLRATSRYVRSLKEIPTFESVSFVAVGKKGRQFLTRTGQNVIAAFPSLSVQPSFKDILPIARLALDGFRDGTYDHVSIMYANFISPLAQQPTAKVLLPLSHDVLKDMLDGMAPRQPGAEESAQKDDPPDARTAYVFEPSPEAVLDAVLPHIAEIQLYQALLEAAASEHSARMTAMRNASDNASEIIDDLTLLRNQTRQAAVTGELAELSASKAALEAAA